MNGNMHICMHGTMFYLFACMFCRAAVPAAALIKCVAGSDCYKIPLGAGNTGGSSLVCNRMQLHNLELTFTTLSTCSQSFEKRLYVAWMIRLQAMCSLKWQVWIKLQQVRSTATAGAAATTSALAWLITDSSCQPARLAECQQYFQTQESRPALTSCFANNASHSCLLGSLAAQGLHFQFARPSEGSLGSSLLLPPSLTGARRPNTSTGSPHAAAGTATKLLHASMH